MTQLISCICPEFGRVKVLGEAVECFLLQDYAPRELVILNDGPVVIRKIADPRLVCIDRHAMESTWELVGNPEVTIHLVNVRERYATLGAKYGALLALAAGAICAFWENDDLFLPWHLRLTAAHLTTGCDMVKETNALRMNYEGKAWRFWGIWDNLCESQAIFRRDAAKRFGFGDHNYAQSYALIDRMNKAGRFRYIDVKPFLGYVFRWNTEALHGECTTDPAEYARRNSDFGDTITPRPVWRHFDVVGKALDAGTPGSGGLPTCAGGHVPVGGMSTSAGQLMTRADADAWRALLAGYKLRAGVR
jgi:glycosyltransferase involved in cell wall biosynthesis